jgi:hypothetical protein
MFGELDPCPLTDPEIDTLVERMAPTDPHPSNSSIPAGFTYLGQFIDHDLTFDAASAGVINFRTPRFDLDSLYGKGPKVQPYLYERYGQRADRNLLIGSSDGVRDLPRNDQGYALIGDPRNDEHQIISQLHVEFARFHNAVVGHLGDAPLEEAQRVVRNHYRWIVVHEYIEEVTGELAPDQGLRFPDEPFMPYEFSGAAYRFGHSMVRTHYGLELPPALPETPKAFRIFPALEGFRPLTPDKVIHWARFFRFAGLTQFVQPSQRINPYVAMPLSELPDGGGVLPRRNLERGRDLRLPSGQAVARALEEDVLTPDELGLDGSLGEATPLWYYVLAEAEVRRGGMCLGPLGGRLVAEVLVGLLQADPTYDPDWVPGELGTGPDFWMSTLIEFGALGG